MTNHTWTDTGLTVALEAVFETRSCNECNATQWRRHSDDEAPWRDTDEAYAQRRNQLRGPAALAAEYDRVWGRTQHGAPA
jgi:hypothetical protein